VVRANEFCLLLLKAKPCNGVITLTTTFFAQVSKKEIPGHGLTSKYASHLRLQLAPISFLATSNRPYLLTSLRLIFSPKQPHKSLPPCKTLALRERSDFNEPKKKFDFIKKAGFNKPKSYICLKKLCQTRSIQYITHTGSFLSDTAQTRV